MGPNTHAIADLELLYVVGFLELSESLAQRFRVLFGLMDWRRILSWTILPKAARGHDFRANWVLLVLIADETLIHEHRFLVFEIQLTSGLALICFLKAVIARYINKIFYAPLIHLFGEALRRLLDFCQFAQSVRLQELTFPHVGRLIELRAANDINAARRLVNTR